MKPLYYPIPSRFSIETMAHHTMFAIRIKARFHEKLAIFEKKAKFMIILIFVLKPVINCRYIWLCWWKWWRKLWIFSWWIIFAQFLQFWRFLDIQTRIAMWHRYSISMQGPKKMYSLRLGLWWWSEYYIIFKIFFCKYYLL